MDLSKSKRAGVAQQAARQASARLRCVGLRDTPVRSTLQLDPARKRSVAMRHQSFSLPANEKESEWCILSWSFRQNALIVLSKERRSISSLQIPSDLETSRLEAICY